MKSSSFSQLTRIGKYRSPEIAAKNFKALDDLTEINLMVIENLCGEQAVKIVRTAKFISFLKKEGIPPIDEDSYEVYKKNLVAMAQVTKQKIYAILLILAGLVAVVFSYIYFLFPVWKITWISFFLFFLFVVAGAGLVTIGHKIGGKIKLLESKRLRIIDFEDRINNNRRQVPSVFRKYAQKIRQNFDDIRFYVYQHTTESRRRILSEFLVARYQGQEFYLSAYEKDTGKLV